MFFKTSYDICLVAIFISIWILFFPIHDYVYRSRELSNVCTFPNATYRAIMWLIINAILKCIDLSKDGSHHFCYVTKVT